MPKRCVKNEFTKSAVQKHGYKKSKFSLIVGKFPIYGKKQANNLIQTDANFTAKNRKFYKFSGFGRQAYRRLERFKLSAHQGNVNHR